MKHTTKLCIALAIATSFLLGGILIPNEIETITETDYVPVYRNNTLIPEISSYKMLITDNEGEWLFWNITEYGNFFNYIWYNMTFNEPNVPDYDLTNDSFIFIEQYYCRNNYHTEINASMAVMQIHQNVTIQRTMVITWELNTTTNTTKYYNLQSYSAYNNSVFSRRFQSVNQIMFVTFGNSTNLDNIQWYWQPPSWRLSFRPMVVTNWGDNSSLHTWNELEPIQADASETERQYYIDMLVFCFLVVLVTVAVAYVRFSAKHRRSESIQNRTPEEIKLREQERLIAKDRLEKNKAKIKKLLFADINIIPAAIATITFSVATIFIIPTLIYSVFHDIHAVLDYFIIQYLLMSVGMICLIWLRHKYPEIQEVQGNDKEIEQEQTPGKTD